MPIRAECESCGNVINAKKDAAGRRIKCPECGDPISVPRGRRKKSARKKTARRRPEKDAGEPDFSNLNFGQLAAMERRGESLGKGTVEECASCGEPVGEFTEECPHCGEPHFELKRIKKRAKRNKEKAQQMAIVEDRRDFEKMARNGSDLGKRNLILTALAILVVTGAGAGFYFGSRNQDGSDSKTVSTKTTLRALANGRTFVEFGNRTTPKWIELAKENRAHRVEVLWQDQRWIPVQQMVGMDWAALPYWLDALTDNRTIMLAEKILVKYPQYREGEPIASDLVAGLKYDHPKVKLWSVRITSMLKTDSDSVLPLLSTLSNDSDAEISAAAKESIEALSSKSGS